MIILPSKKTEPVQINPKKLILFSQPKTGKTEALSRLEGNLILDLEGGAGYVSGLIMDVLEISKQNSVRPIHALKAIIEEIRAANEANGGYVYRFITIDTVSALEDHYAPDLALHMYKSTSIGRNYQGTKILDLPQGAGWAYLRDAITLIIAELEDLCETLIISGHTKDKLVEFNGKEMNQRGLDLAGKTPGIICSKADAIAYLYRKDNKTIANFQSAESLIVGARPEHLKNKEIVLLESDADGNFVSHWDEIFK